MENESHNISKVKPGGGSIIPAEAGSSELSGKIVGTKNFSILDENLLEAGKDLNVQRRFISVYKSSSVQITFMCHSGLVKVWIENMWKEEKTDAHVFNLTELDLFD